MPTANYPGSLYTHGVGPSDNVLTQDEWNQVGLETQAIEAALGANPQASTVTGLTHASVDVRLESIETSIAGAGQIGHRNIVIRNDYGGGNPNRVVTLDADLIVVEGYPLANIALTCSLNVTGAGGLDTGAPANNTWYHLWVIHNPS